MWGLVVTVFGWPREVALGFLTAMLLIGRVILQKVDDRPREWAAEDLVAEG